MDREGSTIMSTQKRLSAMCAVMTLALLGVVGAVARPALAQQVYTMPPEGYGAAATGGTTTYTVTNLNDLGPGSLRQLVGNDPADNPLVGNPPVMVSYSNRRIVFAVAGTINLTGDVRIQNAANVTIDGSTAPSPGITLKNYGFFIRHANNVIIKHMRVRGLGVSAGDQADGFTIWKNDTSNILITHNSIFASNSFADESIGITEGAHDITVAWNIFAANQYNGLVSDNNHGNGAGYVPTRISYHHNVFANGNNRNPKINANGLYDFRNNWLKNCGIGIWLNNGARGNLVNNQIDCGGSSAIRIENSLPGGQPQVYLSGNVGDSDTGTVSTPFNVAPVTTTSAAQAKTDIINCAGSWSGGARDATDNAVVGTAGPCTFVQGGGGQITPLGATASSQSASSYAPSKAIDNNNTTRWKTLGGTSHWFELDLGSVKPVSKVELYEYLNAVTGYTVQYWNGSAYVTIVTGTTIGASKKHTFSTVTTQRIKVVFSSGASISLYEVKAFN